MISINKNSTSISLKKNPHNNFFPSDFFSPLVSSSNNNTNIKKFRLEEKPKIKSKSIYVNLQKEEEEDRELIELLEGKKDKSKKIFFIIYFLLDNSLQNEHNTNFINEVIKEEDEYKNNHLKEAKNNKVIKEYKSNNNDYKIENYNNRNNNNKIKLNNLNNKFQTIALKTPKVFHKETIRSVSTDKVKSHKYTNLNSITNDTSAYTNSLKKSLPYKMDLQNRTEDTSKFRTGLLSAGGSSNNNVIIPIIPMRRPNSNFMFGGEQLWNNFENGVITDTDKKKNINSDKKLEFFPEKNDINIKKSSNIIDNMNKISNYQLYNKFNKSRNNKSQDNKKKYNTFIGMIGGEKIINKLHKIKIEKGMMNSGIVSSLNKKLLGEYHSRIKQFKNSYLPMVFNGTGNKSNKIKYEHSNKNKFRSKSCNKESYN